MKIKFVLGLGVMIMFFSASCSQPSSVNSGSSVDQTSGNINANVNDNALTREREDLEKESRQIKKDLDELQKKIANANLESKELQKKIGNVHDRIHETEKKIR